MIPWKKVTKKILAKYRHELKVERARTAATRDALQMMIQELAAALVAESVSVDEGWDDEGKSN